VSKPGEVRRLPDGPVVLDGEDTAQRFASILTRGVVPAATAGEVFYKLHAAAGIDPAQFEDGLRALGIDLVDLSVAAARHFPALKAVDALRREQLRAAGVRPVQTLSLGDLCCLGYAATAGLPVLTGNRHWTTLQPLGLPIAIYNFRDPAAAP